MRLIQLLLTILITALFVGASYLPLIDANANATVVELQRRMAYHLGENRGFWPRSTNPGDQRTHVCYCYPPRLRANDPDSRAELNENLQAALEVLMEDLGGEASSSTRHSLVFKEPRNTDGTPAHCFTKEPGGGISWNIAVPMHCLMVIRHATEMHALTGYWQGPYNWDNMMSRSNHNEFVMRRNALPREIIHELMHVLGFIHEHQRSDRDDYLYFSCKAVQGYDEMKVIADARGWNMDTLCTSQSDVAKTNRAIVESFSRGIDNLTPYTYDVRMNSFDYSSIMIYPSRAFSKDPGKCQQYGNTDWCPLLAYTALPQKGEKAPKSAWDFTRRLTPEDIRIVKAMYPWNMT